MVSVSEKLLKEYLDLTFSQKLERFILYLAEKCECAGIGRNMSVKEYLEKQTQYVKFDPSFAQSNEEMLMVSLAPRGMDYAGELQEKTDKE